MTLRISLPPDTKSRMQMLKDTCSRSAKEKESRTQGQPEPRRVRPDDGSSS